MFAKLTRHSNREIDSLRTVSATLDYLKHPLGSCLIAFGNTKVICTATIEEKPAPFLRGTGQGWVTAEYSMLPCSTHDRNQREVTRGKLSGRTQEIQRLIGRALRMAVDLKAIGERQIIIDCDVIQADGGTRTAAITGGFIALCSAMQKLQKQNRITKWPVIRQVAAVSCGIIFGNPVLDLDYQEDSNAAVDANFVIDHMGAILEIQGTAERNPFSQEELLQMLQLAKKGAQELISLQKQTLGFAIC
jgi:ribonuclease PH